MSPSSPPAPEPLQEFIVTLPAAPSGAPVLDPVVPTDREMDKPAPAAPGDPALVTKFPPAPEPAVLTGSQALPALPPPLWKQPAAWGLGLLALLGLVLLALAIRSLYRLLTRPPAPAKVAARALDASREVLGVTAAVRAYLAACAPAMHRGLTSAEVLALARSTGWTAPEADALAALFTACDDAKFAGVAADPATLKTTARALIARLETHRREAAKAARA